MRPPDDPASRRSELPGSGRRPAPGARVSGAWPNTEVVDVTVLLRRRPLHEAFPSVTVLGQRPIAARSYLTREEFASRHSARPGDVAEVRRFLSDQGLGIRSVEPVRSIVTATGRADDVGRAFGVELLRYDHPLGAYRAYEGPIRIPSPLTELVAGVFGLDASPVLRPHFRRNADPSAVGYSPLTVGSAYGFPPSTTGNGQSIGILEFGGGFNPSDLDRYFSGLGLSTPTIVPIGIDGGANAPTGDPGGPDAEVELDLEVAGALAPAAQIAVYFAPNTEQGFVDAVTTAVHDATHRPTAISISWGGPEPSWSPSARNALESAAQEGALMGVTIFAAAGDQGASDGEPTGTLAVDFPASSPYVIGCGGTRLQLSGSTIASEVVWNELAQGEGATGGGVSEAFPRPSFQADAHVPVAPNGFGGRGVPDVAADADPRSGYSVLVDGAPAVIGGTSAVAPLWAALSVRLAEALGKPLGYANPLLYPPDVAGTFRPITTGGNGGYTAGPGWNPCTGLGSPQATRLLAALRA